ncbi:MAG: hypothetical protein NXY57DRAFT_63592 [Lentinula lateritia]|nr:MAG: hypothetical protein NXY57DRAFT_63592 [Lentinula lateritia]
MLGVAMFDAQRPDSYTCSRNCLQPPSTLITSIFPWIEDEQRALADRRQQYGKHAALIYVTHPDCRVFNYAPFDSTTFREWAKTSKATVDAAEKAAREAFKNIPANIISSIHGVLVTERIESERRFQALRRDLLLVTLPGKPTEIKKRSRKRKRESSTLSIEESLTTSTNVSSTLLVDTTVLPSSLSGSSTASITQQSVLDTPSTASTTQQLVSSAPSSFSSLNPGIITPTTFVSLSGTPVDLPEQQSKKELIQRYGIARYAKHEPWAWNQERQEHIPSYQYQKPSTLREYWDELTIGLNGYISVQELNNRWEARWRRNISGLKTDKCRYDRVEQLIVQLKSRDNWTMDLVWRFLDNRFPIPTKEIPYLRTTRSFITYIQKKDGSGMNEVLNAADTYP